jgi:hypothetical protein
MGSRAQRRHCDAADRQLGQDSKLPKRMLFWSLVPRDIRRFRLK